MAGDYELLWETMNLTGTLFMDATISEMQTGMEHLLLKVADPIVAKEGGGETPTQISGTRGEPSFGLEKGRLFKHK